MNFTLFSAFGISNFGQFLLGVVAIILLPGPNSLYVLSTSVKRGWRSGALAAFGIIVGDTILMVCAVMGATAILASMPHIYLGLKAIGAAYLIWIGLGLLRAGLVKWRLTSLQNEQITAQQTPNRGLDITHPTKAALGLALTNPKAIFFFLSFFTQFVNPAAPLPGLAFLILGSVLQLVSLVYLSSLIIAGAAISRVFEKRYKVAAIGMAIVGIIFVGFGVNLIVG